MEKVILISDDEDGDEVTEVHAEEEEVAVVMGDCVGVSGEGQQKKKHYKGFELTNGNKFELGDSVLVRPCPNEKAYVAIIRDVTTKGVGNRVKVNLQWLFRPEKAEKKEGGFWQSPNTHEIFYTTYCDDLYAESVMHKCVVHFIPLDKQLPVRSKHPGLIVQRVYDTVEKKLWDMTEYKGYNDSCQIEIEYLIEKTRERLGGFVDLPPSKRTKKARLLG